MYCAIKIKVAWQFSSNFSSGTDSRYDEIITSQMVTNATAAEAAKMCRI